MEGGQGDDKIFGGDGDDTIWGEDYNYYSDADVGASYFYGDDIIYGDAGFDTIYGGAGTDLIHGGEDGDTIYGRSGDDTIWGDEGDDYIHTGTGWDTVFGGDGCDYIYSYDGGDVVWLGACDPLQNTNSSESDYDLQKLYIYGTGPDPENYTVIMDFWLEGASPYNMLCLDHSVNQAIPGAGMCTVQDHTASDMSCLSATDLVSGRAPLADSHDPIRSRGGGCKADGGPLWVTV